MEGNFYDVAVFVNSAYDGCCRLLALNQQVLTDTSLPDELLFGRSGYLFGLLFVRHHLGAESVPQPVIHQVSIAAGLFNYLFSHQESPILSSRQRQSHLTQLNRTLRT